MNFTLFKRTSYNENVSKLFRLKVCINVHLIIFRVRHLQQRTFNFMSLGNSKWFDQIKVIHDLSLQSGIWYGDQSHIFPLPLKKILLLPQNMVIDLANGSLLPWKQHCLERGRRETGLFQKNDWLYSSVDKLVRLIWLRSDFAAYYYYKLTVLVVHSRKMDRDCSK